MTGNHSTQPPLATLEPISGLARQGRTASTRTQRSVSDGRREAAGSQSNRDKWAVERHKSDCPRQNLSRRALLPRELFNACIDTSLKSKTAVGTLPSARVIGSPAIPHAWKNGICVPRLWIPPATEEKVKRRDHWRYARIVDLRTSPPIAPAQEVKKFRRRCQEFRRNDRRFSPTFDYQMVAASKRGSRTRRNRFRSSLKHRLVSSQANFSLPVVECSTCPAIAFNKSIAVTSLLGTLFSLLAPSTAPSHAISCHRPRYNIHEFRRAGSGQTVF